MFQSDIFLNSNFQVNLGIFMCFLRQRIRGKSPLATCEISTEPSGSLFYTTLPKVMLLASVWDSLTRISRPENDFNVFLFQF